MDESGNACAPRRLGEERRAGGFELGVGRLLRGTSAS